MADFEQCDYMQGRDRCLRPAGHPQKHRFTPTKDLQPVAETTDDAEGISEEVEAPAAERVRPITHALSRVDNNLLIAWDTCGSCELHITICACHKGPTPPAWVRRFMERNEPGLDVADLAAHGTVEPEPVTVPDIPVDNTDTEDHNE